VAERCDESAGRHQRRPVQAAKVAQHLHHPQTLVPVGFPQVPQAPAPLLQRLPDAVGPLELALLRTPVRAAVAGDAGQLQSHRLQSLPGFVKVFRPGRAAAACPATLPLPPQAEAPHPLPFRLQRRPLFPVAQEVHQGAAGRFDAVRRGQARKQVGPFRLQMHHLPAVLELAEAGFDDAGRRPS
jgi:hypothetical protein